MCCVHFSWLLAEFAAAGGRFTAALHCHADGAHGPASRTFIEQRRHDPPLARRRDVRDGRRLAIGFRSSLQSSRSGISISALVSRLLSWPISRVDRWFAPNLYAEKSFSGERHCRARRTVHAENQLTAIETRIYIYDRKLIRRGEIKRNALSIKALDVYKESSLFMVAQRLSPRKSARYK